MGASRSSADSSQTIPDRRRWWITLIIAAVLMAAALPARLVPGMYPHFVERYVADGVWAMTLFFGLTILFPRGERRRLAIILLSICFAVEVSQLYQADWINQARHFPGVGLLLGYGFLWSDLIAYTIGIGAGFLGDYCIWDRPGMCAQSDTRER